MLTDFSGGGATVVATSTETRRRPSEGIRISYAVIFCCGFDDPLVIFSPRRWSHLDGRKPRFELRIRNASPRPPTPRYRSCHKGSHRVARDASAPDCCQLGRRRKRDGLDGPAELERQRRANRGRRSDDRRARHADHPDQWDRERRNRRFRRSRFADWWNVHARRLRSGDCRPHDGGRDDRRGGHPHGRGPHLDRRLDERHRQDRRRRRDQRRIDRRRRLVHVSQPHARGRRRDQRGRLPPASASRFTLATVLTEPSTSSAAARSTSTPVPTLGSTTVRSAARSTS